MIDRRAFVSTMALALLAASLAAEAQQAGKAARIGPLFTRGPDQVPLFDEVLAQALRDLGYVEGRNISIERRYAEWRAERLPDLAAELVRLKVDLIVAAGAADSS